MSEDYPVSVIIPVHNGRKFLGEAVGSALGQTVRPCEVIVVDDGSADDPLSVVKGFGPALKYLRQARGGPGAARNAGAAGARGDVLAFLDADDLWVPEKLEVQVKALARDAGLDMVFGRIRQFSVSGGGQGLIASAPHPSTMMIRKESFRRTGGFDTRWRTGEFVDWYVRAKERGLRDVVLPGVLAARRVHGGNMTLGQPEARVDYARILKAAIDRRRGARQTEAGGG